jgi:hypothetical protein
MTPYPLGGSPMKWIVLAGLWVGTLTAAYLVGGSGAVEPPPDVDATSPGGESAESLRAQVEDLTRRLDAYESEGDGGGDGGGKGPGRKPGDPGGITPLEPGEIAPATFSLDGITNAKQLSAHLMKYVDGQLQRGEDGYLDILKTMMWMEENNDAFERLFADEAAALREIYPWVRYLVDREAEVLDMTDYVFRSMAENPQVFEGMDKDPLELFTEGVAAMLPGAVPPDRLARFRGQQPEAIQRNRKEIERALERYWAEPTTVEQALEKLKSGELSPNDAARLLRGLPPETLATVDVNGLLGPLLAAGRWEAIRALQSLPAGTAEPAVLDTHVLGAMEQGKMNAYMLREYLKATGRGSWEKARSFFDTAFLQGEKSQAAAADGLTRLEQAQRPDKAYVEDVLQRYELPDHVKSRLKATYGIQ